ncbi:MFS transporter, partial [bacterium]|nr:MFS transporter [bacterium]
MNLSDNPRVRLAILCALYVAQGIPFGFVTITLKAYLTERGLGVAEIGNILAMTTWPWAFKWVWGPVIDRFQFLPMGRRRPWILLAQTFMALTIG